MAIEVIFRGPILYVYSDDSMHEAVIPDANRRIRSDVGTPGCHPDGSPAIRHFAGVLIADAAGKILFRSDLNDKVLTLVSGSGRVCSVPDDINNIIGVQEITEPFSDVHMELITRHSALYRERVAARVEFIGGQFASPITSDATFDVDMTPLRTDAARKISYMPRWIAEVADKPLMVFSNEDGTDHVEVSLADGQQIIIYNWDTETPGAEELLVVPELEEVQAHFDDTDFKWVYQLYTPPKPTFSEWLHRALPVPRTKFADVSVVGPDAPSPGSSGCGGSRHRLL